MAERIVLWGAGGHARVAADSARLAGYELIGFVDDVTPARRGESFAGASVLGGREALERAHAEGVRCAFVAVGDNAARVQLGIWLAAHGFDQPVLIHPAAVVATGVEPGPGTLVAAGAIVNPGVRLAAHVLINTGATVDHDCTIEDGVHIAPGAHLAGWVRIGRLALIGVGAAIADRVSIGAGATVGVGAAVVENVEPGTVVAGVPAKPLRPA
ncbi:MAG: acetyltransferase [Gemmatimonadota bacterium]